MTGCSLVVRTSNTVPSRDAPPEAVAEVAFLIVLVDLHAAPDHVLPGASGVW